jgi:hypothetical protein
VEWRCLPALAPEYIVQLAGHPGRHLKWHQLLMMAAQTVLIQLVVVARWRWQLWLARNLANSA